MTLPESGAQEITIDLLYHDALCLSQSLPCTSANRRSSQSCDTGKCAWRKTQMKSPEERQAKEKLEILIVISFPALLCRETYLFLIYLPPFFFFEIRSDSVAWCDLKFTT